MQIKLTDGLKSTEAWASSGAIGVILKAPDLIGIPENVLSNPELMTVIVVVQIISIALVVACYTMGRSQVKAMEASPAPLVLEPNTGGKSK